MNFGLRKRTQVTLLGQKLQIKDSAKHLGVYLDSKLAFRDHIEHVTKKLNKFSGMIYKVRDMYPVICLLNFYSSFSQSIMAYGLWFACHGSAAKKRI